MAVFPYTSVKDSQWNLEAPCGSFAAYVYSANQAAIFAVNTTATSVTVPTTKGVKYVATVLAACLPSDGCGPATVYGQVVSAEPLKFTAGASSAGGLSAGGKAGVSIVRVCPMGFFC